mgnify:FL=1
MDDSFVLEGDFWILFIQVDGLSVVEEYLMFGGYSEASVDYSCDLLDVAVGCGVYEEGLLLVVADVHVQEFVGGAVAWRTSRFWFAWIC